MTRHRFTIAITADDTDPDKIAEMLLDYLTNDNIPAAIRSVDGLWWQHLDPGFTEAH